jgi:hypothetical protein
VEDLKEADLGDMEEDSEEDSEDLEDDKNSKLLSVQLRSKKKNQIVFTKFFKT